MVDKYSWKLLAWICGIALLAPIIYKTNWQLPFTSIKFVWFSFFTELALVVLVFLLVTHKGLWTVLKHKIVVSLLVFGLMLVLTSALGINPWQSLWGSFLRMQGVVSWIHIILFTCVLVALFWRSVSMRSLFQRLVVATASAVSLYGIFVFLGLRPIIQDEYLPRISSLFGNPIFFASFLVVPIFLSINLFFESNKNRWVYLAAFGVNIMGLIVSASRGVVLGVVAGLVVAGLIWFLGSGVDFRVTLKRRWKTLAIAFFAVMAIVLLVPKDSYLNRLSNFTDKNATNRLIQWRTSLEGIKHAPLVGVGPENYFYIANLYFDPTLYEYGSGWSDKPHNFFLELLVTTGVVGFLSYLAVIVLVGIYLYKAHRSGKVSLPTFAIICGAFIAYLVQDLFVFDTISAMVMWGFLLGLTVSYCNTENLEVRYDNRKNNLAYVISLTLLLVVMVGLFTVYKPNIKALSALDNINAKNLTELEVAVKEMNELLKKDGLYLDRSYMTSKFAEAVSTLVKSGNESGLTMLDNALTYAKTTAHGDPKELKNWLKLLDMYFLKSVVVGSVDVVEIEAAIAEAKRLGPARVEPYLAEVTYLQLKGDPEGARKEISRLYDKFDNNSAVVWTHVAILNDGGSLEEGIILAEDAIERGVWPDNVERLQWLFDYYAGKQDLVKIENLLDLAAVKYKRDYNFQLTVAEFYLRLSRFNKVENILQNLKTVDLNSTFKDRLSEIEKALPGK